MSRSPYQPVGLSYFFGGQSSDRQLGTDGQFYDSEHVDFRKNPSSVSLLPMGAQVGANVVTDLLQDMVHTNTGIRYSLGSTGKIYRTSGSAWANPANLSTNGGGSILYRSDFDYVYATGTYFLSRIKNASTASPTYDTAFFTYGYSTCTTCTASSGAQTYTTPVAISETATNMRTFTTDIEPLFQIGVKVTAKGTGNWTLTLHDDVNNVLATSTIANASLTNGAVNYFSFSTPIRVQRGNNGAGSAITYHFHVTSTVADGTLQTTTAASLADCNMKLSAYALVTTTNGLHPMMQLSDKTLIGNGRYIAVYAPLQDAPTTADFDRHRVTLPPGFEVCGFAQRNLYAVIAAEKRSSSGEFQEGALFFWDGTSETYNDYWLVPEGSPEAIFSHKNIVYYIAGGALYRMRGTDEPRKIRTFRNTDSEYSDTEDITHVYPNMMAVRRGILLIGYPSYTTNISLKHSVYSLGSITTEYPESWGDSYSISTGTQYNTGGSLKIGMVKSYGDTLYISWQDGTNYGVDIIDNTSPPSRTGNLGTLVYDDGRPYAYKRASVIIATFEALPADTTVKIKYKLDNAASWSYGEVATVGTTELITPVVDVGGARLKTIEFGLDITCDGSISPEITSLFAFVDPLREEDHAYA